MAVRAYILYMHVCLTQLAARTLNVGSFCIPVIIIWFFDCHPKTLITQIDYNISYMLLFCRIHVAAFYDLQFLY